MHLGSFIVALLVNVAVTHLGNVVVTYWGSVIETQSISVEGMAGMSKQIRSGLIDAFRYWLETQIDSTTILPTEHDVRSWNHVYVQAFLLISRLKQKKN